MASRLWLLLLPACVAAPSDPGTPVPQDPDGTAAVVDDRPVTFAVRPPPPLSGGTLLVAHDDGTVFAADPDRDVVWSLDLDTGDVGVVALATGDEPGRLVEDAAGVVHVALRRAGEVASFDPARPGEVRRRWVCPAPRGLAFDEEHDELVVACATGELVTLPAVDGPVRVRVFVDDDLRDVVVDGGTLLVSRFRAAEVLRVEDGRVVDRFALPGADGGDYAARVAWRMAPSPTGGVAVVHQRARADLVATEPWPTGASGLLQATVSLVQDGAEAGIVLPERVLPLDVAVAPGGLRFAVAAAGSGRVDVLRRDGAIEGPAGWTLASQLRFGEEQPVAVAFTGGGALVVQTREALRVGGDVFRLPARSVEDSGHRMFHEDAGASLQPPAARGVACASCHPEGREDGHVWHLERIGHRRTQTLGGALLDTAPYHWAGDEPDLPGLITHVLSIRMGGAPPSSDRLYAIVRWLASLPVAEHAVVEDLAAVRRGREVFEGAGGCAVCHSGHALTNNRTADAGTGRAFQVPSLLGVAARAPFLHDGCAPDLASVLVGPGCGASHHGAGASLAPDERADLLAYLRSR